MDIGEDSGIAQPLEEGIYKMMDRGRGAEHTEVSIVHTGDVAKCGRASIQQLGVHW